MSLIKKEIKKSMTDFRVNGGDELSACFVFDEDFIGFQGHFPKGKVLPGVCQIQCIQEMLEEWGKREVKLKEIVSAKFLLPVSPLENLTLKCRDIRVSGDDCAVKATASRREERVAEFRLKFSFGTAVRRDGQ